MKPYYQDGSVTIYHGDCAEVLDGLGTLSVDLGFTDPPYGINGGRGGSSRTRRKGAYVGVFTADDDTPEYINTFVVPVVCRLIKRSRAVVLTPGNKNFSLYPQPDSFGCFYQPMGTGVQPWGWVDAQPIFYYGKPPVRPGGHGATTCSFRMLQNDECQNGHPCPKPYKTWLKLLERCSTPDGLILDPFMGSGTTLRAAKDLGRKAIGIEIEERYCEIAANRMAQEVLLFPPSEQPVSSVQPELTESVFQEKEKAS